MHLYQLPDRLRFGKHAGVPLREIDASYLGWVYRNCANLDQATRQAIDHELTRRVCTPKPKPPTLAPSPPQPTTFTVSARIVAIADDAAQQVGAELPDLVHALEVRLDGDGVLRLLELNGHANAPEGEVQP